MRKAIGRPNPRSEVALAGNMARAFQKAKVLKEEGKIRLFGISTKIIESVLKHGFYHKGGACEGFYKIEIKPEASFQLILFVAEKLEEGTLSDACNEDVTIEAVLHEAEGRGLVQVNRDQSKDMIQRTKRVSKAQNIIISTLSNGFTMEAGGRPRYHTFKIEEGCWDRLLNFIVSKINEGKFSALHDYSADLPESLAEAEKRGLIRIKKL